MTSFKALKISTRVQKTLQVVASSPVASEIPQNDVTKRVNTREPKYNKIRKW